MILLVFNTNLHAIDIPKGGRSTALGGASVALDDAWSVYNNVAATAYAVSPVAASCVANQYLLPELLQLSGLALVPGRHHGIGISFYAFGNTYYRERQLGVCYARLLAKTFMLGLGVDGYSIRMPDPYGMRYFWSAKVACFYLPTKQCKVGVQADNITGQLIDFHPKERWRTILRVGLAYEFSEYLRLCAEVEKNSYKKVLFKAGIEYSPRSYVSIRIGMNSTSYLFTWGIGIKSGTLQTDISATYHPYLGYSLQGGIAYVFSRYKK